MVMPIHIEDKKVVLKEHLAQKKKLNEKYMNKARRKLKVLATLHLLEEPYSKTKRN